MPDITYDVGRVSFVMKGAWNLATSYEKLDAVSDNGSLYIAKQDVPGGTAITNTTYWQLAVEKGDQGETGNGIASITLTGTAGNVDTYTITFTDGTTTTFTVTNGGVTTVNGRTGDVTGLAEEGGSYPLLNSGTADNLTPYSEDSGATQDIPFIAQGTGCGNGESVVDTGSYLQFKKKLGNTVAVNQLVQNWDFSDGTTGWTASGATLSAANNELTATATSNTTPNLLKEIKITDGHKYLVRFAVYPQEAMTAVAFFLDYEGSVSFRVENIAGGSWKYISQIVTASATKTAQMTAYFNYNNANNGKVTKFKEFPVSDLTCWFGSNDRIPSDLLAHPENWGRYYAGSLASNAGTLENADGSILTSIHRNIWDEEWENGYINYSTGVPVSSSSYYRSKNFVPVIPNAAYNITRTTGELGGRIVFYDGEQNYISTTAGIGVTPSTFTTPTNARFLRFYGYGQAYANDITISLYYSGESGYDQYYPYSVLAEVDTGSEVLRGVEGSRDEKLPSGTIIRNRARIDLGTLNWGYTTSYGRGVFYADLVGRKVYNTTTTPEFICPLYVADNSGGPSALASKGNMLIAATITATQILITNDSYSNAATFKTAMSGVYLEYPLATPTTEQGTAFAENIPCDDFGSLMWTQTKGIPQGNEIFYPVDYKASIDTLYKRVGGDMSKIVTKDEYPEAPSSDGTYVLKATVSGGTKTYAWVAE